MRLGATTPLGGSSVAGRTMGGPPQQTARPLLILQDASMVCGDRRGEDSGGRRERESRCAHGRGEGEGGGGRRGEGSSSASPYDGVGAPGGGGGDLQQRGLASGRGLRPASGGSRFLTDPAGWMTSAVSGAVDNGDAATLLLSQQQQQLSRGPHGSRDDSSLLSPRRQQLLSAARSSHSLRREGVAAEVDAAGIGADPSLGELRKKVRRHPGEGAH